MHDYIIEIASLAAALTVIGVFIRKTAPYMRKLGHLIDDLAGEPERDGVPARPSLIARVAKVETAVVSMERRIAALEEANENRRRLRA